MSGGKSPEVLVLSMRRIADVVGYVAMYEFEDLMVELLGAELVCPTDFERIERVRRAYKLLRFGTGSSRLASLVSPAAGTLRAGGRRELFLAVFNHPHELFALEALRGWRESARFAACYVCEAWESLLPGYLLELLRGFDHVFLGVEGACKAVARITGRPTTYLPMATNTLRFAPPPGPWPRTIDLCGIGRRSPITHAALLAHAESEGLFYYYDTIQRGRGKGTLTFRVIDPREHRLLFANLLKRSRYFIANRAWADQPSLTGGKDEIASRFYEGAAAGAVMLGEPPDTDDFRRQFDWPDAVVQTPFHAPDIGETVKALDADPVRVNAIRTEGVVQSLLRHDWSHRLRVVLEAAGMRPSLQMLERQRRLAAAADAVRAQAPRIATA
ncbi:MAG TPA: glycosyltransferase [Myxococcaceae bacterium]|nr:glycosyltransferase [Myxococcaceae bacterium]